EQLVGDRAIEGHPHVAAVDHGLRGNDPLLVRGGRQRQQCGDGQDEQGRTLHGRLLERRECARGAHGVSLSETAPSSLLRYARPDCADLTGQVKGILSSSRPPTSRTASTTRVYSPGASFDSSGCASSKPSSCVPAGRVGPVTPSTGTSSVRPDLRHHWRRSGSHLVPWPSLVSLLMYQTARLAACLPPGPSTNTAT